MEPGKLPIIDSCDDCGACCQRTPVPPFAPGEEAAHEIPSEWANRIAARIAVGQEFDLLPCVWFDRETRRCCCYEIRPAACRAFEVGSDLCRLSRWDEGIDG
ncbi:MAG: YkgJ family cysteine cluster protein [Planctomycetaceae bacterium]|nr:YkgJ family cysteine cluster protein [Planctomycetaceae bacterium]